MISLNPVRRMSCFRIDNDDADDGDVLVATALVANGGSVREEGGGELFLARSSDVFILNFRKSCQSSGREAASPSSISTFPLRLLGVMCVCRAGLVLLCVALALSVARRSSPEQEDVEEKIHSARCASRCLTLHMTQLTAAFRHLQVQTSKVLRDKRDLDPENVHKMVKGKNIQPS